MGRKKTYNWEVIQEARNAGMSIAEICKKFGCSPITLYHRTKPLKAADGGPKRVHVIRHHNIDWPTIQRERDNGAKAADLIRKYNVSSGAFYTKTHANNGKTVPVVHHVPNAPNVASSPFAVEFGAANGSRGVARVHNHIHLALRTAKDDRKLLQQEARHLDKVIQKLEAITQ